MVKMETQGEAVILKHGKWYGASPSLLEKLEAITEAEHANIGGEEPNPPMRIASTVIRKLGGRITKAQKSESVPGRIYGDVLPRLTTGWPQNLGSQNLG